MNAIPLINNIPKTNINNEKQLRQEINTSLVALKKEAGTLEGLINEAAQMLVTINNRIATLENNTVKKSDVVDVVQSGNLQPVTSNAVFDYVFSGDVNNRITNYNNALKNGFYFVNGDTVNCPPASLGFLGNNGDGALYVQRYNDDWICQICQDFRGNGGLYVRSKNNGTWGSWQSLTPINSIANNNLRPVTSEAVYSALSGKANAVSGDKITSIASLEVTSGVGSKNQYVSSITLPAGSRYLVFFSQSSDISDTSRMDGTYVSDAGEFSVVPNSTMGQGNGSVRIAYYKSSSNDRVIRYGLGYKYNTTACTFTWRVNAIRLA